MKDEIRLTCDSCTKTVKNSFKLNEKEIFELKAKVEQNRVRRNSFKFSFTLLTMCWWLLFPLIFNSSSLLLLFSVFQIKDAYLPLEFSLLFCGLLIKVLHATFIRFFSYYFLSFFFSFWQFWNEIIFMRDFARRQVFKVEKLWEFVINFFDEFLREKNVFIVYYCKKFIVESLMK